MKKENENKKDEILKTLDDVICYYKKQAEKQKIEEGENFLKKLKNINEEKDLEVCPFSQYITKNIRYKNMDIEQKKGHILKNWEKYQNKWTDKQNRDFDEIKNAPELLEIVISIEWKKSKTWGLNPYCTAKVYAENNNYKEYTNSASGCGYDKESTVIAGVLNQSYSFLKILYKLITEKNDLYGYYKHKYPSLSGGVGTSCYYPILEKCGYKMTKIASGKSFDVYKIERGIK